MVKEGNVRLMLDDLSRRYPNLEQNNDETLETQRLEDEYPPLVSDLKLIAVFVPT